MREAHRGQQSRPTRGGAPPAQIEKGSAGDLRQLLPARRDGVRLVHRNVVVSRTARNRWSRRRLRIRYGRSVHRNWVCHWLFQRWADHGSSGGPSGALVLPRAIPAQPDPARVRARLRGRVRVRSGDGSRAWCGGHRIERDCSAVDGAHRVAPRFARRSMARDTSTRICRSPDPGSGVIAAGAPGATRTHTGRILSPLPLPIGLRGRCAEHGTPEVINTVGRGSHYIWSWRGPAGIRTGVSLRTRLCAVGVVMVTLARPRRGYHDR